MKSVMLGVALAIIAAQGGRTGDGDQPPVFKGAEGLARDSNYKPKAGDQAVIGNFTKDGKTNESIATDSLPAYQAYVRATIVKDFEVIDTLWERDAAHLVPHGTPVRIIAIEDVIITTTREFKMPAVTLKYLDGPRKGEKAWVHPTHVMRLVKPKTE